MTLNATSLAAGIGVAVRNTQFATSVTNLARKILALATYDPAKTDVVPLVPVQVLSPEDAGNRFGFGSMAHRLALQAFIGGAGVPVYVLPQAEAGGAVAAAGDIDFTGSTATASGTLPLYIAGYAVPVTVTSGMTAAQIATAVVAAITARKELPINAAVDGVTTGQVNFTAKSKGPWGNSIDLSFNLEAGDALPAGVTGAVTDMAAGAGIPTVADALAALGTGDDANEAWFTDIVHGYGQDATTLNAISDYVGAGNDFLALYGKTVARPFRALTGDTAAGSQGLADLVTLSDGRKLDRANGVEAVPGSQSHPAEIAAQAIGHMARIAQQRVAQNYIDVPLIGIRPGAKADRWTSDYDNRDTAVKSGISPTRVRNGVVYLQNVVSFYRPDSVPVENNGYRSMRNIAIVQNMLNSIRHNFEQEKWQGISVVGNTARVGNMTDRIKARDTGSVVDDYVALARGFENKAWVYEADYTIKNLAVAVRAGSTGFDGIMPVILSGEGGILDTEVQFDISQAVLTN